LRDKTERGSERETDRQTRSREIGNGKKCLRGIREIEKRLDRQADRMIDRG